MRLNDPLYETLRDLSEAVWGGDLEKAKAVLDDAKYSTRDFWAQAIVEGKRRAIPVPPLQPIAPDILTRCDESARLESAAA